jgi:predicted Zn-dependent protease
LPPAYIHHGALKEEFPVRFGSTLAVLGLVMATGASVVLPRLTSAQEVNCANEFRSGKLYFAQKIYRKAVDHLGAAVKACPDKAEYRARYAIALAQLGEDKLKVIEATGDVAGNKADVDSVVDMYKTAGSEFDASLKADASKPNVKFVNDNRKHFWVARYNEGIKLSQEQKADAAVLEFKLARYIDPSDIKAHTQGAIELINQGNQAEAAALINEGLAIAPNDTTLARLKEKVGADEARNLVKKAEASTNPEEAAALCARADSLYSAKLAVHPKEANTYFDRGLERLTRAAAVASKDSAQSVGVYGTAAEDFHKARELVPATSDSAFYQSALYNEIQATMNAGEVDKAEDMIREYMKYDCKDAGMWKTYAAALYLNKDQQKGAVALIISSAMSKGNEVPIADAIKNAQEDAKKASADRGNPTHVYAYTEDMGGKTMSIEVWTWCDKEKANVYYLGKDNGEVDW